MLNKYVGQSEENIRALFADAEAEYKERGDESDLHIIIFDEIDSVNLRSDRRDERRDMASLTTRCMRRSHIYEYSYLGVPVV